MFLKKNISCNFGHVCLTKLPFQFYCCTGISMTLPCHHHHLPNVCESLSSSPFPVRKRSGQQRNVDVCPKLCRFERCLTSPLVLIKVVWNWSPVPQLGCVFQTRSEGGLWLPPAPAAQIWSSRKKGRINTTPCNFLKKIFF